MTNKTNGEPVIIRAMCEMGNFVIDAGPDATLGEKSTTAPAPAPERIREMKTDNNSRVPAGTRQRVGELYRIRGEYVGWLAEAQQDARYHPPEFYRRKIEELDRTIAEIRDSYRDEWIGDLANGRGDVFAQSAAADTIKEQLDAARQECAALILAGDTVPRSLLDRAARLEKALHKQDVEARRAIVRQLDSSPDAGKRALAEMGIDVGSDDQDTEPDTGGDLHFPVW